MNLVSFAASVLLACASADASRFKRMPPARAQVIDSATSRLQKKEEWTVTAGEFQQLIDHSKPELGTFTQRYWYSDYHYAGPGSPVVFFNAGETNGSEYTGYASNWTIAGLISQAVGGANIVLEHRYWGGSSPFTVLSTANLTYLTLENSIKDTTYFARNVHLPFDPHGTSAPHNAPWIFTGGSYTGGLAAWTSRLDPGIFWAYHASSATIHDMTGNWYYFEPVRDLVMPKNCSADVVKVIDHVDRVLTSGSEEQKQALKDKFGLGSLASDDFANALSEPMYSWQGMDFYDSPEFPFLSIFDFCDYVEGMWNGSNNSLPGAKGVGLERALDGYAKWTNDFLVTRNWCQAEFKYHDFAAPNQLGCFDSRNRTNPQFTDYTLDNAFNLQWTWLLCNFPLEDWTVAPPAGEPSIVSRLTPDLNESRSSCASWFPPGPHGETYGIAAGKTADTLNAYTGGWDDYWANTTRLIWTNGQLDPWLCDTVSSERHPGGPLQSTAQVPVNVIPGAGHCFDLIAANGEANADVQKVIDKEVAVLKGWVDDFYKAKGQ